MLLKHDKSVIDISDAEGRTCLHWSAKAESSKCMEVLLKVASDQLVNAQDHEQVGMSIS